MVPLRLRTQANIRHLHQCIDGTVYTDEAKNNYSARISDSIGVFFIRCQCSQSLQRRQPGLVTLDSRT